MKKIGIFCLTLGSEDNRGRLPLILKNLKEIKNCTFNDYHFYILSNNLNKNFIDESYDILKNNITVVNNFTQDNNYLNKIYFALDKNHEFSIKMDDDTLLIGESWDRFFELVLEMTDDDLFCTGNITSGIPTCDTYISNFLNKDDNIKLKKLFYNTDISFNLVADYSELNNCKIEMNGLWDENIFYKYVKNFKHYYKGIHPIRVSFENTKELNDCITKYLPQSLTYKKLNKIKDCGDGIYPYFCNNFFGIKTKNWKSIVDNKSLYVDIFDEVPLNRYREITNKNMIIDLGLPILHTVYNWVTIPEYEKNFIETVLNKLK